MSSTTKAGLELRAAHAERSRGSASSDYMAANQERKAAELLVLDHASELGPGREVISEPADGTGQRRAVIRETLGQGATRIAEDASIARTDLLLVPGSDALAMALDAAEAIGAQNSLEKMLAHQMAVAHDAAMRYMTRSLSCDDTVESARLANVATRLLSVYQDGLLTLQRLRTGGSQTVTVQHVNVQSGAQAVIGNVTGGRRRRRGG